MGQVGVRLRRGNHELNLNDLTATGIYRIAEGFVPPSVSLLPNLAAGTSANRFGGADLVTIKGANRRWAFPVNVGGASEAEITLGIRRLDQFLRSASIEDPVFLHYRSSEDVGFEPLWGQYGADRRYEIVFGSAAASRAYPTGVTPNQILPECTVELNIKPLALGKRQRLGSALGGVLHDTIGAADGYSRGVIIPEGGTPTNKFENPIFSFGTYDTAWTTGANLIQTENIDRAFITHAKASVKITATAATLNTFHDPIAAGNTNTHTLSCYVKLADGSAPTSADLQLYYGSAQTTSFINVGNGWYRAIATFAGISASTNTGVVVKNGRTVYVDGFQLEEAAYATALAESKMVGCRGVGGEHNRTAARLRIDAEEIHNFAQGSIRVVWKADKDSTDLTGTPQLFREITSLFRAEYRVATTDWLFSDGTNEIDSAAEAFSEGDKLVLHFTWKPGSLKIYLAGAEIATGSTYTPEALGADVYIGSDDVPAQHMNGTFMDFSAFSRAMTATEVLDDAANILRVIEDDRRLSPIPYLYTEDGDDLVDNKDSITLHRWCVIGGIPGSEPANLEIAGTLSNDWDDVQVIWISRIAQPLDNFVIPAPFSADPAGVLIKENTGTTGISQTDPWLTIGAMAPITPLTEEIFHEKQVHLFSRLTDAGAALHLKTGIGGAFSDELEVAADATNRLWQTLANTHAGPLGFSDVDYFAGVSLDAWRPSGSANVVPDYVIVMMEPLTKIGPPARDVASIKTFALRGQAAITTTAIGPGGNYSQRIPVGGSMLEVEPEKYNVLMSILGAIGADPLTTWTLTYSEAYVEPRWALV